MGTACHKPPKRLRSGSLCCREAVETWRRLAEGASVRCWETQSGSRTSSGTAVKCTHANVTLHSVR